MTILKFPTIIGKQEGGTFPESSLYRCLKMNSHLLGGKATGGLDGQCHSLSDPQIFSQQLTLKMMNKTKNARTMNRRQLESNARRSSL